jgi:transcription elongation factor SPT6
VVESSDDDLDDDLDLPQVQDIQRIWDDERAGGRDDEDDIDDMDNFIDYDEEELGVGSLNEDEREERRRERRRLEKERRKAIGARPELAGIDAKWVLTFVTNIIVYIAAVHGTKFTTSLATVMNMIGPW